MPLDTPSYHKDGGEGREVEGFISSTVILATVDWPEKRVIFLGFLLPHLFLFRTDDSFKITYTHIPEEIFKSNKLICNGVTQLNREGQVIPLDIFLYTCSLS